MTRTFILYADGGSRGNPGAAAYGVAITENGKVIEEIAKAIGTATNNYAEYSGLVAGLQRVHEIDPNAEVDVRMDSKLVVEQMSGRWQIKHPDMRGLAADARAAHPPSLVRYSWIAREENTHADKLVNQALDNESATTEEPIRRNYLMERLLGNEVPTTLYLVRHGETPLTPFRKFSGSGPLDPELTEEGARQASLVAKEIAKLQPEVLISSPMARTRQTAEQISRETGLDPIIDPIWVEQSFGLWDGLSIYEVQERFPKEYRVWLSSASYAPPEGESYEECLARARQGMENLVTDFPGKRVAVATHNGMIKTSIAAALSTHAESIFNIDVTPCSITTIAIWPSDGLIAVRGVNERGHLR
jgi:ribonuclease H / adenosylcobalamin/alpha-ribazole phosphatase